jgi:hypothetical protein
MGGECGKPGHFQQAADGAAVEKAGPPFRMGAELHGHDRAPASATARVMPWPGQGRQGEQDAAIAVALAHSLSPSTMKMAAAWASGSAMSPSWASARTKLIAAHLIAFGPRDHAAPRHGRAT